MKKKTMIVGDRVRRKYRPEWGVGVVVEVHIKLACVSVRWPSSRISHWQPLSRLEFAETPIERMKRRFNSER